MHILILEFENEKGASNPSRNSKIKLPVSTPIKTRNLGSDFEFEFNFGYQVSNSNSSKNSINFRNKVYI